MPSVAVTIKPIAMKATKTFKGCEARALRGAFGAAPKVADGSLPDPNPGGDPRWGLFQTRVFVNFGEPALPGRGEEGPEVDMNVPKGLHCGLHPGRWQGLYSR